MKKTPYQTKMWAVMRDGETYMILPSLGEAETHLGLWSKNGFSSHTWGIKPVTVRFQHETPSERKRRLARHVQAVVQLNQAIAHQHG